MILANKRHVIELDELQRKVYLNALAITVGVAIVVGIPYSVMNTYHEGYSAKSKDLGDDCWQMLFGAFRPQT